jgi:hypothetical protein
MASTGDRIWRVEVRETTDYEVRVRETDLHLPPDASDNAAKEAAGRLAEHMVTARHPDAISYDTTREAGQVHQP